MPKKTENSMKDRAIEFYNSYQGDKISFNSFYQMCRKDSTAERGEVIKRKLRIYKPKYKGRWAVEMEWYDNHPEPKSSKPLYTNRLRSGICKEEAILIGDEWLEVRRKRDETRKYYTFSKTYTPTYSGRKEEEFNPDFYRIDITYPQEVAKVFRETYEQLIAKTEETMQYETEKLIQVELNTKLELLQAELSIFISYNK